LSKFIPILSTKRLKPDLIREALLSGLAIIDYDFITVSFIETPIAVEGTIIFTSKNAVAAFCKSIQPGIDTDSTYTVYCLSGETLALAQTIPAFTIKGFAGNALSLAKKVAADGVKKINFICGRHRRDELPDHLRLQGIKVREEIVYDTLHSGHPVKYSSSAHPR
jgi:uroporphyrinogen-III synthase